MPRKPPLLAAMDGDPPPEDRRKAYDRRMREGGNVKLTLWVHRHFADDLKLIAKASSAGTVDAATLKSLFTELESAVSLARLMVGDKSR